MALDLMDLAYHATGGVAPRIDKYWTAAMLPLMVFLGGVYRFYAHELRGRFVKSRQAHEDHVDPFRVFVGILAYAASCAIFAVVVLNILDPIGNETCPPAATPNLQGRCPIIDPKLKNDADAVVVLTFCLVGIL